MGPTTRRQWGSWTFDTNDWTLTYENEPGPYPVNLDKMWSCALMLDMIFQVAGKRFPAEQVGYFVLALNEIFHPQKYLCSGGNEQPFWDARAYLEIEFGKV